MGWWEKPRKSYQIRNMIETQNLEKIGDQDISGKVFDLFSGLYHFTFDSQY